MELRKWAPRGNFQLMSRSHSAGKGLAQDWGPRVDLLFPAKLVALRPERVHPLPRQPTPSRSGEQPQKGLFPRAPPLENQDECPPADLFLNVPLKINFPLCFSLGHWFWITMWHFSYVWTHIFYLRDSLFSVSLTSAKWSSDGGWRSPHRPQPRLPGLSAQGLHRVRPWHICTQAHTSQHAHSNSGWLYMYIKYWLEMLMESPTGSATGKGKWRRERYEGPSVSVCVCVCESEFLTWKVKITLKY